MQRHLIDTKSKLRDAVKELCTHNRLSHDTETKGPDNVPDISGLFPFHGARSFAHIFSTKDDDFYFNFNVGGINPKYKSELQPIFDDENRIIFYINAIFDGTISHFDNLTFKQRVVDGPSIARIEYNKHGTIEGQEEEFLSLGYLAEYYGVKQKNDAVKEYIKEHELYSSERCRFTGGKIPLYNRVPIDLMFEYGCDDTRSTFDICTQILKCINYKDQLYAESRPEGVPPMIEVAKNEIKLTSALIDVKIGGVKTWPEYIEKAVKHESDKSENLKAEIDKITGGINIGSGKQLAEFLVSKGINVPMKKPTKKDEIKASDWLKKAKEYKEKGKEKKELEAIQKAETYRRGRYKTDKKTLKKIVDDNPGMEFLQNLTKAKECDKKISTYYEPFLKLADKNGVIHCGLNQEKAKTGRFSSSMPNLQNLHKEKWNLGKDEFLIRKSFIADNGCFLMAGDYDQQEMIAMLDQAGEMAVIEKLMSGEFEDFYLATAAILKETLGVEITRQEAKDMALGLAYGKGLFLLAQELGYIPIGATEKQIEEAKQRVKVFKDQFFKALPKLSKFVKYLQRQVRFYGKIHNAYGRVIYLDEEEAYKALNAFVQSTSADMTKKAMAKCHGEFKRQNLKSRILLQVHDELIFNVHPAEEELVKQIARECMVTAYDFKNIPLSVGFEKSFINSYGVSPWGEKVEIS